MGQFVDELVMDGGHGDDALYADAILACCLEDSAHEDVDNAGQIGPYIVKYDGGIFAA